MTAIAVVGILLALVTIGLVADEIHWRRRMRGIEREQQMGELEAQLNTLPHGNVTVLNGKEQP